MNRALTLGTAAVTSSLPVSGAILNIDFGAAGLADGLLLDQYTAAYVDLSTGATRVDLDSPTATEIQILFANGSSFTGYHAKAQFSATAGSGITFAEQSGTTARYGYGTALTQSAPVFDNSSFSESGAGVGNWGGFTGVAFVSFAVGANEGWLALDYQAGFPLGTIELLQLQYGNAGEELTTPAAGTYTPIPEPAAAGALLAGCAAVFALRRRRKG